MEVKQIMWCRLLLIIPSLRPTCSITACVSNLIELRAAHGQMDVVVVPCPTNHSVRTPTFEILQNFPKPVWPGRTVRPGGRPTVRGCQCRRSLSLPARAGRLCSLLDGAWASYSNTARRFRILLCSSLRCTGHLQQAGPHCQFTHDKPFRVKSWPYWSSWVVSSWLSRTRSIVLLPDGLAVTSTATATEDQLQFFSADNRETSQSSPSVQTLSYCRTRWQWSRWSNIVAGLVNFEDKPSTPWKVSQASNGGEIISISKSHHITNIEYV